MTETIVFPDAEAFAVAVLNDALDVPVSTKVPNPRPPSFVRVVLVGGTRRNLIVDSPMLVFECWAESTTAASALAQLARANIGALPGTPNLPGGVWVYKVVEIGGPQSFPDPVTESPRYQFTVQLHTRGTAL